MPCQDIERKRLSTHEGSDAVVKVVLLRLGSEPARQAEAGRFATRLTGPILGKVAVPMTVDST